MSRWIVYKKNGEEREISYSSSVSGVVLPDLEYTGNWMGECFVSLTFKSPVPIEFEIGDYILYRGEKFVINYNPTVIKKSRRGTYGEGFSYDSVKFNSLSYELTDIRMLDYVLDDNFIHYSGLPKFSFFCESIDDFADRLQANVSRYCASNNFPVEDYWIILTPSLTRTLDRCESNDLKAVARARHALAYGSIPVNSDEQFKQSISVDDDSVWDMLTHIKDSFGLNFINRGRSVIIGSAGIATSKIFGYGKGNGLYEIERTADSEQQIVTMLYAYGSSQNLPVRYYANLNMVPYGIVDRIYGTSVADIPFIDFSFDIKFSSSYFTNGITMPPESTTLYSVQLYCNGVEAEGFVDPSREDVYIYVTSDFGSNTVSNVTSFISAVSVGSHVSLTGGVDIDKWPGEYRDYDIRSLPNNMAIDVLMLPGFPDMSLKAWVLLHGGLEHEDGSVSWKGYRAFFSEEPLRPYILSMNYTELGIREATKYFDGSDDTEEIYPTIEGTGFDVIVSSDIITDNGVAETVNPFHITLPDFGSGFDLKELLQGDTCINMKDGYCSGRSFAVKSVAHNADGTWTCTCDREHDSSLDLWFPYSHNVSLGNETVADEPYQVRAGDKYVLTGIEMTKTYVEANAEKLLEHALSFLSKNDYTRYTFVPRIDEIFMAREHDNTPSGEVSLHDSLKEGDIMLFEDGDLDVNASIYIDTLRIKEYGNGQIPTYEVTLRNDKQVGTIARIQEQIKTLTSTGGGGGVNVPQIESLIRAYGSELFLSKKYNDAASGLITFLSGISVGTSGHGISADGNAVLDGVTSKNYQSGEVGGAGFGMTLDENGVSTAEVDKLIVRMKAVFAELEIKKKSFSTGDLGFSDASNKLLLVLPLDGDGEVLEAYDNAVAYRCCWLMKDGEEAVSNDWHVDDQARCQTFNIKAGVYSNVSNRYYWRKVLESGEGFEYEGGTYNYIDLAATISGTYKDVAFTKGCQSDVNNDIPKAGDDVVQLGNQSDTSRQNYTEIIVNGNDAPAIKQYQGIDDYTLSEKLIRGDYYDRDKGTYRSVVYGDFYAGDRYKEGGYAEYDKATNTFNVRGVLQVGSVLDDGRDVNSLGTTKGNLLRNSGFTGGYESEPVSPSMHVDIDTVIYSDPFGEWVQSGCTAVTDVQSASGMAAIIGSLSQTIVGGLVVGNWYTFSMRAKDGTVTLNVGGVSHEFELTDTMSRYDFPFVCLSNSPFTLSGTGSEVCDLILMEGNLPSEWHSSSSDNDKSMAEYYANEYLRNAITEASTTINGGLILTQIINVGNYREGAMISETGGMSGAFNDGNSPFLWGGGTMSQAIYAIMKYANDPSYQPTDAEVSRMAKFVVTHGGRAILNDIILRGYIYALGGVFNGTVYANKGVFGGLVVNDYKTPEQCDGVLTTTSKPHILVLGLEDLSIMCVMPVHTLSSTEVGIEIRLPMDEYYNGKEVKILSSVGVVVDPDYFLDAVRVCVNRPDFNVAPSAPNHFLYGVEQRTESIGGRTVTYYGTESVTFDSGVLTLVGAPYDKTVVIDGQTTVIRQTQWFIKSHTFRKRGYGTHWYGNIT